MWDAITEIFKVFGLLLKRRKSGDQILKVIDIYDAMNNVLRETDVQRFLVLKAHNGGGTIKPGSELYVSVVYECYQTPFRSVKNEYQRLLVDAEYIKMLSEIYINRKMAIDTLTMPNGLLKDLYEKEQVSHAEVYFLHQSKKEFYFLSVATAKDANRLKTHEQQAAIMVAVNKIRNTLNQ